LKISKKLLKIAKIFEPRFWKRFGSLLGGVWEAKISDFRTFFMNFSNQKSNKNFGRQKNGKNWKKEQMTVQCGGVRRPLGGRIYRIGGAQHASNFKFSL